MPDTCLTFRDVATRSRERGDRLRAFREKAGLSQEAVARRVDVTAKTVSNWEKGSGIHPDNLHAVAKLYGRPVEELQDHVEIPSPFKVVDQVNELMDEFRNDVAWIKERMAEQDRKRESHAVETRDQLTSALEQQNAALARLEHRLEVLFELQELHARTGDRDGEPVRRGDAADVAAMGHQAPSAR